MEYYAGVQRKVYISTGNCICYTNIKLNEKQHQIEDNSVQYGIIFP